MASISDKLKAVVMSGVITATSLSGASAMAADNQQAKAAPTATQTQTARKEYHPIGSTPGTFENLFLNPRVQKQLPDAFWENGKKFAEIVKQNAAKGNFWNMPVYEGVPPIAQFMPGYPKTPIPGGALNVKQFAEYVNFVALNGDPRLTAAGKPNAIFPKVILGVVTPRDTSGMDIDGLAATVGAVKDRVLDGKEVKSENTLWRARMAAVKKEAVAVEQKYGASHGAAVYEIVRVIADANETIVHETGVDKGKPMPLKGGVIVTIPDRGIAHIAYDMFDLEVGLAKLFTDNAHVMTNREYYCQPGTDWSKMEDVCPTAGDTKKGLAGTGNSGAKDKGGSSSSGKGTAGAGKVAAEGPAL